MGACGFETRPGHPQNPFCRLFCPLCGQNRRQNGTYGLAPVELGDCSRNYAGVVRWSTSQDDDSDLPLLDDASGETTQQTEAVLRPPPWLMATLVGVFVVGGGAAAWGSLGSGSEVAEGLDADEPVEAPASTTTLPQSPQTSVVGVTPVGEVLGEGLLEPLPDGEGGLWAWVGDSLFRVDLSGGSWEQMAAGLDVQLFAGDFEDPDFEHQDWQGHLVRLDEGWLLLAGLYGCEDHYWVLDDVPNVVLQGPLYDCARLMAVGIDSAAVVVESGAHARLLSFEDYDSVIEYRVDGYLTAIVLSPTGQIFASPETGGIYDVTAGGAEVASSGRVVAAGVDRFIVVDCGTSLGDCGYRIIGDGASIPMELSEHITGPLSLQATWLPAPDLDSAVIVGERASVFDLGDGTSVTLQLSGNVPSMSWSEDSTLLVLGAVEGNGNWSQEAFVFDLDTGTRHRIDPPLGADEAAYAFGP